jgi:hypothetical protein
MAIVEFQDVFHSVQVTLLTMITVMTLHALLMMLKLVDLYHLTQQLKLMVSVLILHLVDNVKENVIAILIVLMK